jgi:uncharacterized delta-60 repeat protein
MRLSTPCSRIGSSGKAKLLLSRRRLSHSKQQHAGLCLGAIQYLRTLDQTFGNNGSVEATFGDPSAEGNDILLQADGKIIVVGFTGLGSYADNNNFALVRYNPDGTIEQAFGSGGKVVTAFLSSSVATSAVLQSDGRFVVAGTCKSATLEFCLARYNADGSLDSTFGSFGEVMTKHV